MPEPSVTMEVTEEADVIEVMYPGPSSAVVTSSGLLFPEGEPVSVPVDLAEALIRQGFEKVSK